MYEIPNIHFYFEQPPPLCVHTHSPIFSLFVLLLSFKNSCPYCSFTLIRKDNCKESLAGEIQQLYLLAPMFKRLPDAQLGPFTSGTYFTWWCRERSCRTDQRNSRRTEFVICIQNTLGCIETPFGRDLVLIYALVRRLRENLIKLKRISFGKFERSFYVFPLNLLPRYVLKIGVCIGAWNTWDLFNNGENERNFFRSIFLECKPAEPE